jgi:MFS family permease
MSLVSHALSPLLETRRTSAALPTEQVAMASPPSSDGVAPRSLDDYLQHAYDSTAASSHRGHELQQRITIASAMQQIKHQWRYMLIITALGISSAADAAEMFTIGYVLGDPGFQQEILKGDLATGGALVAGILNIGLIIGGLSAGSSEGRLGRRYIMLVGLFVTSVAGFGCAAVPNVGLFAFCRFVAGMGIGPVLASTAPLATELSPPKERGFVVSVANSFWTVGLIANGIWAYIVFEWLQLSWRVFLVICTLPSVIGSILIWWLVPESPRHLALQRQYDRAARNANKIALALGYRGALIQDTEIEHQFTDAGRRPSQIIAGATPLTFKEKLREGSEKIKRVLEKDLRKPTLTIMTLWIAASMGGSIGQWLVTIFQKLQVENLYAHFILLNCACIPGNVASAVLTDRVGRNRFFTFAMLLSSVALFGTAAIVFSAGADDLASKTGRIIFCTSFFYASMTGLYTCLYVMAAELFPTNVRSTGVALCSTFGRIASVLCMYLNGALIETPATLLTVGGTVLIVGSIVSVIVPPNEMMQRPVLDHEDSTLSFDDEFNTEQQQPAYLSMRQNVSDGTNSNQGPRERRASELKYLAG